MDIKKYCEYLYNSSYIPVYLYDSRELTVCYPSQDKDTFPPSSYLSNLWETDRKVTYTMTGFNSYYGCVKIENSSSCLVIGPINDFPYMHDTLLAMEREFAIKISDAEAFANFFHNIPIQNLDTFINILLYINYTINNTEMTRKDLSDSAGTLPDASINRTYSRESYAAREEGIINNSYEVESEMMRYIETGNLSGLQKLSSRTRNIRIGTIAHNSLRQWKNMFIVAVALTARAAIKGGLTPSIAYQLSDIYIQQVERLSDPDAVKSLWGQAQLDYANRVANSIVPAVSDTILRQVIQFIRANTNRNITVADVAGHVGFTRPALSRKVKKELGFEIGAFIRRCKLEEAKDLLTFSDKSISEISNDLCFSSQSHFQRSFKDKYGITPQAYRKSI